MSIMLPSGISLRIREDLIDGASRTQTTLIIDPIVTLSGHRVTMADIGDKGFGKIDQGNSSEELMSWTGIIDNTNTYTLTGCIWGINFHNLDSDVDNRKRHTSGNKFSINTDMHFIAEQFVSKDDFDVKDNTIGWGDGADSDKRIEARNGDTNKPYIKYDAILNKWIFSNNGIDSYDPSAGGSGIAAGDAVSIIGGELSVKVDNSTGIQILGDRVALPINTDSGLEVDTNKLQVKVLPGTGLAKDTNGLSLESIDPDAIAPQVAGFLTGGTGHSALSVFQALGSGANNGKFKINIDGTEYDNVGVDLKREWGTITTLISQATTNSTSGGFSQSFTIPVGQYSITGLTVTVASNSYSSPATINVELWSGDNFGSGTLLKSSSQSQATFNSTITFGSATAVEPGEKYYFKIYATDGSGVTFLLRTNSTSVYSGGVADFGGDAVFSIIGNPGVTPTSLASLATFIQLGLRTATSATETVIYDTNKFKIISSTLNRSSQVLKLMTPSTGTDISGAGATPYLDMATNATETLGTGEEYNLVRLDGDGKYPQLSNHSGDNQVVSGRAINTVYQNTKTIPIFVNASVRQQSSIGSGVVEVHAKIGTTSTPAISIARYTCSESGSSMAQTIPMSFIVPAGYYYAVATVGGYSGSPSLTSWFECDLI